MLSLVLLLYMCGLILLPIVCNWAHFCSYHRYFSIFLHLVAPYNVNITGDTMYSQKEQLVLSCLSEGGPELEYSWIIEDNVIATIPTLTIDNVTASNGGEYTCNVTNDAGYDSDTITVYSEFVCICMNFWVYTHNVLHVYDI